MQQSDKETENFNKQLAAVCGLYCPACTIYIGTQEDPERLKKVADRFGISPEEAKCFGCRSEKRLPYCESCKMYQCAQEKGIDFCGECESYPCEALKSFQAARPHRLELWNALARIKEVGYQKWADEMRAFYACPACDTINSAYDMECRKCGAEPSCAYVKQHKRTILKNR